MWAKMKVLLVGASIGLFVVSGCTQYASKDDLARLEEQKKAALAAEQKVQELEKQKADLERQVAEKQAVIDKLKRDLDAIKE